MANETKETIILDFQVEQGDAITELEKTKKSIIELKKEQQELTKAYKAGNVTLDEYASESVRVESILKKQTSSYNTLQKSATGVKTQFDKLVEANQSIAGSMKNSAESMAQLIPGLAGVQNGIATVTQTSKAFIATPIGAVIGALGLAVGALTSYFRGSEEGQNRLNKIVQIGTTIFEKFMDVIEYLGEKVFDGLAKGIEVAANGFDNMAKFLGINTQIVKDFFKDIDDSAKKFYETERQIAVQERALILQRATTAKKVAELREQAISQEGEAKKKTIQQAIALEKELSASEVRLARLRETLAAETVRQRGDDVDAQKEWVEATAARIGAEAQAYEATLRFQKELEKINDEQVKQQALVNQGIAEEIRLKNELEQVNERLNQQTITGIESIKLNVGQVKSSGEEEMATAQKVLDKKIQTYDKDKEEKKKQQQLSFLLNQQQLANTSTVLGQIGGLLKEGTQEYKLFATAQATIDTIRAATAALAPPPIGAGPVLGPILAAITTITGLANVAKINEIGFSEGGYTGPGQKYEPAGIVHKGEVVFNQRDVAIMGGPNRVNSLRPTFKGYAEGGIVTAASTAPINQAFAFRSESTAPVIVASWKEATELNTRIQMKEALVTK